MWFERAGLVPKIEVGVFDNNGDIFVFRINMSTPMRKLMDTYSNGKGLQQSSVSFVTGCQRTPRDHTAAKLGMKHGDIIELEIL